MTGSATNCNYKTQQKLNIMKPLAEISLLSIIFNACVQKNVKIFSVAFLMVVLRVLKVQISTTTFHSTYKTITLNFNLPDIILKA